MPLVRYGTRSRPVATIRALSRLPGQLGSEASITARNFLTGTTTTPGGAPTPGWKDMVKYGPGRALDRTVLEVASVAMAPPMDRKGMEAHAKEVARAAEVSQAAGWVENPRAFHVTPRTPAFVESRHQQVKANRVERKLQFRTAYRAKEGMPGTERWKSYNQDLVKVKLLQHTDRPRPWLVVLHGIGMGTPYDLRILGGSKFHEELGLNVAGQAYPLSGPRAVKDKLPLGPDLVDTLNAQSQGLAEVRQTLRLIRSMHPDQPIVVMGVSMGGFATGLVSSFEKLEAAVPVIPGYDYVDILAKPVSEFLPEASRATFMANASKLLMPINIDALKPKTFGNNLHVVGAKADLFTHPESSVRMAKHFGSPLHWNSGGHVSAVFDTRDTVEQILRNAVVSR